MNSRKSRRLDGRRRRLHYAREAVNSRAVGTTHLRSVRSSATFYSLVSFCELFKLYVADVKQVPDHYGSEKEKR